MSVYIYWQIAFQCCHGSDLGTSKMGKEWDRKPDHLVAIHPQLPILISRHVNNTSYSLHLRFVLLQIQTSSLATAIALSSSIGEKVPTRIKSIQDPQVLIHHFWTGSNVAGSTYFWHKSCFLTKTVGLPVIFSPVTIFMKNHLKGVYRLHMSKYSVVPWANHSCFFISFQPRFKMRAAAEWQMTTLAWLRCHSETEPL